MPTPPTPFDVAFQRTALRCYITMRRAAAQARHIGACQVAWNLETGAGLLHLEQAALDAPYQPWEDALYGCDDLAVTNGAPTPQDAAEWDALAAEVAP